MLSNKQRKRLNQNPRYPEYQLGDLVLIDSQTAPKWLRGRMLTVSVVTYNCVNVREAFWARSVKLHKSVVSLAFRT